MRIPVPPSFRRALASLADANGTVDLGDPRVREAMEAARVPVPVAPRQTKPPASTPATPTTVNLSARQAAKGLAGLAKAALRTVRPPPPYVAERKAICRACPHLKAVRPAVAGVASPVAYEGCDICGCRFASKVLNPGESCPDKPSRWGPVPKA